jgi:hypothetical protein
MSMLRLLELLSLLPPTRPTELLHVDHDDRLDKNRSPQALPLLHHHYLLERKIGEGPRT